MRRSDDEMAKRARDAFGRCRIMTLDQVAAFIKSSIHTARRRLKQWRACHSYNHNGRYYTLPHVPEFDVNGLWRWRGAFFSQSGNLKQSVIELVHRSPAGLDASELRTLLGLDPVRSFPLLLMIRGSSGRKRKDASSTTVRTRPLPERSGNGVGRKARRADPPRPRKRLRSWWKRSSTPP